MYISSASSIQISSLQPSPYLWLHKCSETLKGFLLHDYLLDQARLTVVEEEEPEKDIPPEFRNLIRDNQVMEGEPVTFDCQVSGHPKPTVHWEKVGGRLGLLQSLFRYVHLQSEFRNNYVDLIQESGDKT